MGEVPCSVGIFIRHRGGSEEFLKSFTKGSYRFTNLLFIALYSVMVVPVNYSTFLCGGVSLLRDKQKALDGVTSFEENLYFWFATDTFETFI